MGNPLSIPCQFLHHRLNCAKRLGNSRLEAKSLNSLIIPCVNRKSSNFWQNSTIFRQNSKKCPVVFLVLALQNDSSAPLRRARTKTVPEDRCVDSPPAC